MKGETRRYPSSCTSAYCGHVSTDRECMACSCRPRLDAWKAWVKETKAVCKDPIWSPSIYTATE